METESLIDGTTIEFRNAQFNRAGWVSCEINHPVFGWVPFNASPEDPEQHGREIFERAKLVASPVDINELADFKKFQIDVEHANAVAEGFPYDFNGTADVVQTRERDQQNLLNVRAQAQSYLANSEATEIGFRALSNTVYNLTPEQAVAMVDAVMAHMDSLRQKAWSLKDKIDDAVAEGNREAISAIAW